jgi:hypothetical protein
MATVVGAAMGVKPLFTADGIPGVGGIARTAECASEPQAASSKSNIKQPMKESV